MYWRHFWIAAAGVTVGSLVYHGVRWLCWFIGLSTAVPAIQIMVLIAMSVVGAYYLFQSWPIMYISEVFWLMFWFGPITFVVIWWLTGSVLSIHTAESFVISWVKVLIRVALVPVIGGGIPLLFIREKLRRGF